MDAVKNAIPTEGLAKIVLVEDHPLVCRGIRAMVDQQPDLTVVGEADNVAAAVSVIQNVAPDLAVVDLNLKESRGLDLIKDIQIRFPHLLVLVLSMRDEAFYAERVLHAGARGYVSKEEPVEVLIDAIRKVLRGQIFLSQRMASRMLSRIVGSSTGIPAGPSVKDLTDRELEVFELIGHGLPARDIAKKLHLSVKTVDSHREHIKAKLGVESATELLKYAFEWLQSQQGS